MPWVRCCPGEHRASAIGFGSMGVDGSLDKSRLWGMMGGGGVASEEGTEDGTGGVDVETANVDSV